MSLTVANTDMYCHLPSSLIEIAPRSYMHLSISAL